MVTDIESMELVHTRLSFVSKLFLKTSIFLESKGCQTQYPEPRVSPSLRRTTKIHVAFSENQSVCNARYDQGAAFLRQSLISPSPKVSAKTTNSHPPPSPQRSATFRGSRDSEILLGMCVCLSYKGLERKKVGTKRNFFYGI